MSVDTFATLRPVAVRFAEHARNAERVADVLRTHDEIGLLWDRLAEIRADKPRGAEVRVAREVLGYGPEITCTRDDAGKHVHGPDGARLEALMVWIKRNAPKADAAPKAFTIMVNGSGGDGSQPTGNVTVPTDHPAYAMLLELLAGQ